MPREIIDPQPFELAQVQRARFGLSKRKLRKPGRWAYPQGAENRYVNALLGIVRIMEQDTKDSLLLQLPGIVQSAGLERKDTWVDDLDSLITSLEVRFGESIQTIDQLAQITGLEVDSKNAAEWARLQKKSLSITTFQPEPWLTGVLQSFQLTNEKLIDKLTQETLADINTIVHNGILSGKSVKTIQREVLNGTSLKSGRFKKTQNRAKFIARDQVGKLNGRLTEFRQTSLGIKKYIWRTSIDERVRPSHASKEGNTYDWNKPPADTGHPGEDYQCRCYGEPIFEDVV